MRSHYHILWDDREKKPLKFPTHIVTLNDGVAFPSKRAKRTIKITNEKRRLFKGDYLLEGFEDRCVVERKAAVDEIAVNCFVPHRRRNFVEELDFLISRCQHPVILMAGNPQKWLRPTKENTHPGLATAAIQRLLLERGIMLVMSPAETLPARLALGEWVAHLLVSAAVTNRRKDATCSQTRPRSSGLPVSP